jgi:ABC-2 type transport system permease protein
MEYYPNLDQYFAQLIPPILKFLPNNWLTDSLFWTVLGDYPQAAAFYFYQITVSLVMFFFAAYLGHRLYYKTWLNNINTGNKTKLNIAGRRQVVDFEKESSLPPQTEVILKREILTFIREPNQVIHLALLLFLIFIFIVSMRGVSLLGTRVIQLQTINYLSVFSFNIFLISTLALRFVYPLASIEGEAFWKVKSSPIMIKKIFKIKVLVYLIPIILISQLLSYFSNRIFSSKLILLVGILTAFIATTFVYINFGMGSIFANYKEKNAIRISSSQGAAISFLISLLFIAFQIAILFLPLHNLFQLRRNTGVYDISFLIIPSAAIIIISATVSVIFFKLGIKALKKDF